MGGCSGEVLTEIVTAEHGATEQIAEDGLLMFANGLTKRLRRLLLTGMRMAGPASLAPPQRYCGRDSQQSGER
jgi:hypothetical protein